MKEYYLDRKEFSSFCFCWWKPLLKLERIKFLKNNLIFLLMEIIGGIQFLKVTLFWQMETVLELSFCQWKPLQKLERIKFLKNNLIFLLMEIIGGIQFLKVTLFWQMETDFRAFFLLVETIIEIRRNSVFKKYFCQGKLVRGRENEFLGQWKSFFSPFCRDSCQFFPSRRKVFFKEILHSGWWKRICCLVKTVFVCSELFL